MKKLTNVQRKALDDERNKMFLPKGESKMPNEEMNKEISKIQDTLYQLKNELRTSEASYICNRLIEQCANMKNLIDVHDLNKKEEK